MLLSQASLVREVQLDFTPEMEVLYMLFERCHAKDRKNTIYSARAQDGKKLSRSQAQLGQATCSAVA